MKNKKQFVILTAQSYVYYYKMTLRTELVFGVYLVYKVEPNLMLRILGFLVKVRWVELGGTDSLFYKLRLATWF